jgi:hypothetical protein
MSRSLFNTLGVVAALSLTTVPLCAQNRGGGPRIIQFVVNGGAAVPTGKFSDAHDMGLHAAGSIILNVLGLRLRPEATWTKFNIKDAFKNNLPCTPPGCTTGAGSTQMIGAMGNIELPLFAGLYVIGGVGELSLSTDNAAGAATFKGAKFTIDGGAGWRARVGAISVFLEGRVNSVYTDQGAVNWKDVKVIPVTFGLVF